MSLSRLSLLAWLLLLLSSSFLLAVNLSHWMLPGRSGLTRNGLAGPLDRAGRAEQASLLPLDGRRAIHPALGLGCRSLRKTTSYMLTVASLRRITFPRTAPVRCSPQISDQAQSMTPFGPAVAYGPELRRAGNSEWRFPQHVQITAYLQPGRNVIAVFAQSPSRSGAQFAIQGEILGEGQRVAIPAKAQDWKTSTVSSPISGHAMVFAPDRGAGLAAGEDRRTHRPEFLCDGARRLSGKR